VTEGVALVILAAGRGERFGGLKQLAPAGPNGETMMDYSIHNGLAAGFTRIIIVVRSEIEGAVEAHVRQQWGEGLPVAYATQPIASTGKPGGTAGAVLAARGVVANEPFVVSNGDDLYGQPPLGALHGWLSESGSSHALAGFPLIETLLPGSGPVTRALCGRRPDGTLARLVEAAVESRHGRFVARPLDGSPPIEVGPDALVSMNAFAFRASVWPLLEHAISASAPRAGEILLPVVVAGLLDHTSVVVLPVADRCIGVTWARDLAGLQEDVRRRIQLGELPAQLRL
jgi:nucleotidyltransferase-like protein